ncbi:MAG: DMT family transporter [Deltaproteobacteria bacterium]|nr:MAG: DMT family transporter [Deltaproteobacteria bacterium]
MLKKLYNNGYFLIPFAAIFYTSMSTSVKFLGDQFPLPEIIFFRTFTSVVIIAILMLLNNVPFKAQNLPLLLARSISGLFGMIGGFYALRTLSLGDTAVLTNTFPIFVAVLSYIFFDDKPSKALTIYIFLALVGIGIILKPQFNFFNYAGFIALMAGFFSALVVIAIHQSSKTEPALRIAFYFMLTCTLIATPLSALHWKQPQGMEWFHLLNSGVCGSIGQIFMTRGYGLHKSTKIAPLSYIGIIFSFISDMIFWNAIPNLWSLAGSLIIVFCCIKIVQMEKLP